MCSSGEAFTQTVKQLSSSRLYVSGSETMPPPTVMHHLGVRFDDALEAAALDAPVARLPVEQEHLGQADAGLALDLAVELDERAAAVLRERRAERRLAGAAQADERDALLARRFFVAEVAHQAEHDVLEPMLGQALEEAADQPLLDGALAAVEQLGHGNAERARDAAQQQDRRVAFAGLELGEVALRHVRVLRQDLARHAAALARFAHVPAHRDQEIGVVRLLGGVVGAAVTRCSVAAMARWAAKDGWQYNACLADASSTLCPDRAIIASDDGLRRALDGRVHVRRLAEASTHMLYCA